MAGLRTSPEQTSPRRRQNLKLIGRAAKGANGSFYHESINSKIAVNRGRTSAMVTSFDVRARNYRKQYYYIF
jgi:hypothetical protein